VSKNQIAKIVSDTLSSLEDLLSSDEETIVELRGLGTFIKKQGAVKKVYLFNEKKSVEYSDYFRIRFKPSKKLIIKGS